MNWANLQNEMANCTRCREQFPKMSIQCPPGLLYPNPPSQVKILFVGAAPPRMGDHFYSNSSDKLRSGLFPVLSDLGYQCRSVPEFLSHNFFLTHTAKCSIAGNWRPNKSLSAFCAAQFLRQEIDLLKPHGVCIFSKNVGPKVADILVRSWGNKSGPDIGTVADIRITDGRTYLVVTSQPVRGWDKDTRPHVAALLERL
jgi:Uracil DNA glycosylase superfamily